MRADEFKVNWVSAMVEGEPGADDPAAAAAAAGGEPPAPDFGEISRRIDELLGGRRQAEASIDELRVQNQSLQSEILRLKELQLAATHPGGQQGAQGVAADNSGGAGTDDLSAIRKELSEMRKAREQERVVGMINNAHAEAFSKAVGMFPELSKKDSPLAQASAKVFGGDPALRAHPLGPLYAAQIAASFLRAGAVPAGAKLAAGAGNVVGAGIPSGATTDDATQLTALKAELAEVLPLLNDPGTCINAYPKYTKLRMQIGEIEKKQQTRR